MTMGRPFDAGKVPSLVLGKTTQAEVRADFGRQETKDLYIRFNADGTEGPLTE